MNKKFSTLLCASLLFSSAFSAVNAADLNNAAVGAKLQLLLSWIRRLEWSVSVRVGTQVLVYRRWQVCIKERK